MASVFLRIKMRWLLFTLCIVTIGSSGCRLFDRDRRCTSRDRDDRDDRYCAPERMSRSQPNCDPVLTGYGQPMLQGSVVGAMPGPYPASSPIFGDQPDNELPFPKQTIPNPNVPLNPPFATHGIKPGVSVGLPR